jgi:hypothetical protein
VVALGASLLLHTLLVVALVSTVVSAPRRERSLDGARSARLVSGATAPPITAPEPPPAASFSEAEATMQERAAPVARAAVVPRVPRPARAVEPDATIVRVTTNVDTDGAPEADLQRVVDDELRGAVRVPLEFAAPPVIDVPVAMLRGVPQWRIRALVRVHAGGGVELVRASDSDAELIYALRDALERSRARPAGGAGAIAPGWALIEVWYELAAGTVATR